MTAPKHPAVLTGLALGDALGAPFEPTWEDPPDVNPPGLREWGGGMVDGHLGPAGTTTDDTGMAAALARAMASEPSREYLLDHAAAEYLEWYFREKETRGIGGTIRAALEAMGRGGGTVAAPLAAGRVGNGTAMRIAPLGMRYWRDPRTLVELSILDANITHHSTEAAAGSAAVALAVAYEVENSEKSLRGSLLNPLHRIVHLAQQLREPFRYTRLVWALPHLIRILGDHRSKSTSAAEAAYLREAREIGADGDVVHTVITALLAASLPNLMPDHMERDPDPVERARDQFRTGVRLAVQMGGDTDTRAAITGAILGARVRQEGLPPEWVAAMAPEQWAELERLDAALYEAAVAP